MYTELLSKFVQNYYPVLIFNTSECNGSQSGVLGYVNRPLQSAPEFVGLGTLYSWPLTGYDNTQSSILVYVNRPLRFALEFVGLEYLNFPLSLNL